MVQFIEPEYSKRRVNKAGNGRRADNRGDLQSFDEYLESWRIIENWRACHAYVLNTFQTNLRDRAKKGKDIVVAQRLKRRVTIVDKLNRHPNMQLSRMNDIAGCRVIFPDEISLFDFRASLHTSRAKHILRNRGDGRYNYIEHPKDSGYRGVHDVYEYHVESEQGAKWNGMLIEIQYRTAVQHAWATAVEVADMIGDNRIKFSQTDPNHMRFFQLASEMLARHCEGRTSCCPELTNLRLVRQFEQVDRRIGLMLQFRRLRGLEFGAEITKNSILIFNKDKTGDSGAGDDTEGIIGLEIETFPSMLQAIERYQELERLQERERYQEPNSDASSKNLDIVMVRGEEPQSIREAFKNYFSDVTVFMSSLDEARIALRNKSGYL